MATALAKAPNKTSDNDAAERAEATNQIVGFRLANEEYGVDIMRVQEIILPGEITQMPEVPDYICGLINLRGHVIPIVDLRKRFGLPVSERDEHTRIIVVNVGTRTIGMVVDAVNEVLRITEDQLEPPPSSIVGIEHVYIKALVKFDDKLLILLDIESILSREETAKLIGG
ncbi:MAG: chemotaxis protein CheW [Phycisphaerales bacterium]|nr:chemotaxis protein CheW [Phycisphaerales bacterium]MCB9862176.1 chemotaxis protein CheW [Phycisphaerales bacterium]